MSAEELHHQLVNQSYNKFGEQMGAAVDDHAEKLADSYLEALNQGSGQDHELHNPGTEALRSEVNANPLGDDIAFAKNEISRLENKMNAGYLTPVQLKQAASELEQWQGLLAEDEKMSRQDRAERVQDFRDLLYAEAHNATLSRFDNPEVFWGVENQPQKNEPAVENKVPASVPEQPGAITEEVPEAIDEADNQPVKNMAPAQVTEPAKPEGTVEAGTEAVGVQAAAVESEDANQTAELEHTVKLPKIDAQKSWVDEFGYLNRILSVNDDGTVSVERYDQRSKARQFVYRAKAENVLHDQARESEDVPTQSVEYTIKPVAGADGQAGTDVVSERPRASRIPLSPEQRQQIVHRLRLLGRRALFGWERLDDPALTEDKDSSPKAD